MTKHPLDTVESALVDASNAFNDMLGDFDGIPSHRTMEIDDAIDDALRRVQAVIRYDLNPPDPRD